MVGLPMPGWLLIVSLAANAGAVYPNLVAAQWALESGFGQQQAGVNNPFGMKGYGSVKKTKEWNGSGYVHVYDEFKNYNSLDEAVQDVVDKWHKDYKGYKGVNNAKSREDAAWELYRQGYATDPAYANKLISLMDRYSEKTE